MLLRIAQTCVHKLGKLRKCKEHVQDVFPEVLENVQNYSEISGSILEFPEVFWNFPKYSGITGSTQHPFFSKMKHANEKKLRGDLF